jgi:phosphomannomutase
MNKLCSAIEISKDEILFVGDKLQEGGNDYPVKAMGIDTIEVRHEDDTVFVLEGVLGVTDHDD